MADEEIDKKERRVKMKKKHLLLVFVTLLIGFIVGCSDNNEAAEEAINTGLSPDEILNTAFKDNFPLQFESYLKNMESDVEESKLVPGIEPMLPILFNNYGFATEYNVTRGHPYAIEDVENIARINDKSIGSCMTCKATAVPALIAEMGDDYWSANFRGEILPKTIAMGKGGEMEELGMYGHISIGCSDCHDPVTMDLRITRPTFANAMDRRGIDITKASKNEMRSYVCAQCHVEYYFEPENSKVRNPWDNGLNPEDMFEYFENQAKEEGFEYDWLSSISGAPMLKAQHPEFEIWSQGPHGQAGVSCADCHMPYQRESGEKFTSHKWGSPLDNVQNSCQTCHSDKSESYLKDRVTSIQDRHLEAMDETQHISVKAHYYVNRMYTAGAPKSKIEDAQYFVRKGQWFWDILAAENSDGFHNPQGGMDSLRMSSDASNEAIRIATSELSKLDVDFDELDREIEKVLDEVYGEEDTFIKKDHAINDFFPNVLELN